MRLKRLKIVSCLGKGSVSALLMAGMMAGCSSDFSRFTDGIGKSSAPAQKTVPPAGSYPPAPQKNSYGKVESSSLAPPAVSESGAAPAAGANSALRAVSPRNSARMPADTESRAGQKSAAAQAGQKISYIVVAGDTLIGIAERHQLRVAAIKRDNGLKSDKILIGQKLILNGGKYSAAAAKRELAENSGKSAAAEEIPTPSPEPIAPPQGKAAETAAGSDTAGGETQTAEQPSPSSDKAAALVAGVGGAATAVGLSAAEKRQAWATGGSSAANKPDPAAASTGEPTAGAADMGAAAANKAPTGAAEASANADSSAPMIWPAKGNIISTYGQRTGTSTNDGIDIAVPEGTPVKAAESGMVIYAGDGLKEFGNTILIRHDDNVVTVYGHNSKLLVQRGRQVQRGQDIAQSGSSGNAGVAKLHFEVRKNSAPVNPMKYLPSTR